jgi:hypothetical protein
MRTILGGVWKNSRGAIPVEVPYPMYTKARDARRAPAVQKSKHDSQTAPGSILLGVHQLFDAGDDRQELGGSAER